MRWQRLFVRSLFPLGNQIEVFPTNKVRWMGGLISERLGAAAVEVMRNSIATETQMVIAALDMPECLAK